MSRCLRARCLRARWLRARWFRARWFRTLCLAALTLLLGCVEPPARARSEAGEVDLSQLDPYAGAGVALDGAWDFWWGQLLEPEAIEDAPPPTAVGVPGPWDSGADSAADGPLGVGTYRLRVRMPRRASSGYRPPLAIELSRVNSAYRLWINGEAYPGLGVVSPAVDGVRSHVEARIYPLPQGAETLEIVLEVANAAHRVGGLRQAPVLGAQPTLERARQLVMIKDTINFGTLVLVGLSFIGLFYVRRRDPERMWFGPFCLLVGLRSALAGDGTLILMLAPELSYSAMLNVEYVLTYLGLAAGIKTFAGMYPLDDHPPVRRTLMLASLAMALACALLDSLTVSDTITLFHTLAALSTVYVAVLLVRAVKAGRPGSQASLLATFIFAAGVAHDALLKQDLIHTRVQLATPAFLGFVLAQGWSLARAFAESHDRIQALSTDLMASNQDLEATNKAVQRFVPFEFLRLLKRRSIRDIHRGDHAELEMEVLFCDLRSFTTLVESKDPDSAFDFINSYLRFMEPTVHDHGGFINQYLGDCIMALFPSGADEALASAVDMAAALEAFNAHQLARGDVPVRVSVGVSSGHLMLGTIGGMDRLDSGVIGDPVNLAARLEGMNRIYGSVMIISERTMERLEHPERLSLRELDLVVVKGKTEAIRIYEVLDLLPPEVRGRRVADQERFDEGLRAFRAGDFAAASAAFAACLERSPDDGAAELYAQRCERMANSGAPDGWTGVTIMTHK